MLLTFQSLIICKTVKHHFNCSNELGGSAEISLIVVFFFKLFSFNTKELALKEEPSRGHWFPFDKILITFFH